MIRVAVALVLAAALPAAALDRVGPPPDRVVIAECLAGCTTGFQSRVFNASGLRRVRFACTINTGAFDADLYSCIEKTPEACEANGTWALELLGIACNVPPSLVTSPVGFYRINVTTCAGCTYRVWVVGGSERWDD